MAHLSSPESSSLETPDGGGREVNIECSATAQMQVLAPYYPEATQIKNKYEFTSNPWGSLSMKQSG